MAPSTAPPNVLFLLSDEHAFRYLSFLSHEEGGEPVRTPVLDGLARRGTFFENAYCQMPLCTPSRICMLTGRDQEKCGAWSNNAIFPPDLPTLPGHLAAHAGYQTALIGKMHFGGSRQFNGFRLRPYGDYATVNAGHQPDPLDEYEAAAPAPRGGAGVEAGAPRERGEGRRRGGMMRRIRLAGPMSLPESFLQEQIVAREAVALLREQRHRSPDQPWLLCTSFSRPHFPWTAPRRYWDRFWPEGATPPRVGRTGDAANHAFHVGHRKRFQTEDVTQEEIHRARAAYMACVEYLDEILGDFLSTLERDGLLDNSIVVYTTDHGEMGGEHGLFYKNTYHEAAAHVPFIVQTPEQRRGDSPALRVQTPVSLADLFPTLCGLTGVPVPDGVDGVDLSGAIRSGDPTPARKPVISQSVLGQQAWRMLRRGDHKFVTFADPDSPDLLFDVVRDPDEQHDLARDPAHAALLAELRAACLDGFDFRDVQDRAERERADLAERFPKRIAGQTPNQLLLSDGRLVEGDAALYLPTVVAERPADVFDDWPGNA
ncbi:MAG TPA: sulfatase-like hydrolase/transferase [Chloroflexota bacterium]|nr:sulfatase-like hydrolase/transferase [Chloroflexota bacterium]